MRFARLVAALMLFCHAAVADDYADARAKLVAAYQAQDYLAMVHAATAACRARPGYPGADFNLAMALALHGEPEEALRVLVSLSDRGVDFGVEGMEAFAGVRALSGWTAYEAAIAALRQPRGVADRAQQLENAYFVPEGIAISSQGEIFLGSIRKGILLRGDEVVSERQGHWSVFGMRFHADGSLWFASAAVPQFENVGEDVGKTGLFRLDVGTGRITRSAILPPFEDEQVLGDLVIAGNEIFTTDSLTGAVYRYDIAGDEYSALVARGKLGSPQGLTLDATGKYLYVADYTGGLYRISVPGGHLEKMTVGDDASDFGIDGLYRYEDRLIAIQNGIRPHRVVSFQLDDSGSVITHSRILAANLEEFDEPTLGAVHGDDFYFVANSHWNRFDRENRLPGGLSGPIVLKVSLDP